MTELYEVVEGGGETKGVFSTLDKAMAAVEARVLKGMRAGEYGRQFKEGPLPALIWHPGHRDGVHVCGYLQRPDAGLSVYTIQLDPAELP